MSVFVVEVGLCNYILFHSRKPIVVLHCLHIDLVFFFHFVHKNLRCFLSIRLIFMLKCGSTGLLAIFCFLSIKHQDPHIYSVSWYTLPLDKWFSTFCYPKYLFHHISEYRTHTRSPDTAAIHFQHSSICPTQKMYFR